MKLAFGVESIDELAAFAEYERAVIATRTQTGRRESVRKNGRVATVSLGIARKGKEGTLVRVP